jgi:Flp pilus assembly protein TadD
MDTVLNPRRPENVATALARGQRLLAGAPRLAAEQARAILGAAPHSADAYRLLGAALRQMGDGDSASAAELAAISVSVHDPEIMSAASALVDDDLPAAEAVLRPLLHRRPTDVAAIRMMAELAARVGRPRDSEHLLRRALELAPGFAAARANLATLLYKQHRWAEALAELEKVKSDEEIERSHQGLRAATLGRVGGYQEAIQLYRLMLEERPGQPKVWMSLGHVLKTVGEQDEAVIAYRRAIAQAPGLGEAWWSLANLKTLRFVDADVTAMRAALAADDLSPDDRLHLNFALGKALEDLGSDGESFACYAEGNRTRAAQMKHDPGATTRRVDASEALFTPEFFRQRQGLGCPANDPIFILGMPRAGSTLVEQILASHPLVEGTAELPDIIAMVRRLNRRDDGDEEQGERYPALLANLDAAELVAIGEEYLARTRIQRQTDRPLFIDKMPNNWAHVGFIRLILPNAKIIDARRHPLACGFSNFKQHYARGQSFSYDLAHIGHYYRDYVRLMDVFDRVDPGAVHRVIHERLVADPEQEVRRLLDYLGLPFDPACLRFLDNKRAVRTASSEQVRRPITAEGLDQWRRFDEWLLPLKASLGPALDSWNDAAKA